MGKDYPYYALWRLLKGLERLTGLTLDEILHQPPEKKAAVPAPAVAPEKKDDTCKK